MQRSDTLTLADAVFPRIESEGRVASLARDLSLMVGFAAFVAVFAQIQVRLPWTPVPLTGQTFAALVTGGALGAWRGAGSLSIYAIAGMIGLPVFTPGNGITSGSWDLHFVLPWHGSEGLLWHLSSGGYIVGFILAAALVGFLAERRWDRGPWVHVGLLAANALVYLPGLLWLGHLIAIDWVPPGASKGLAELIAGSSTLDKTMKGGLYPFIVGDLMKLMLAAIVLPGAWLLVDKVKRQKRN